MNLTRLHSYYSWYQKRNWFTPWHSTILHMHRRGVYGMEDKTIECHKSLTVDEHKHWYQNHVLSYLTINNLYFSVSIYAFIHCPSLRRFHWLLNSLFNREPPFWSSRMWDESWFTQRCSKVNHLKQSYSSSWCCWARYFNFGFAYHLV